MELTREQRWDDKAQDLMAEIEGAKFEADNEDSMLISNPQFLPAMGKIAEGFKEIKIDWGKVKKIKL